MTPNYVSYDFTPTSLTFDENNLDLVLYLNTGKDGVRYNIEEIFVNLGEGVDGSVADIAVAFNEAG